MSQEQVMDILAPIITALAPVLIALVGWLTLTLRKQVEVKTAAIKHEELRKWVTTLVMSAEQQFTDYGKDEVKLAYATEETLLFVQSLGLTLTREQVRALIEAAVHAMSIQEATTITIPPPAATATSTTTTEAVVTSTTVPETGTTAPVITTNAWDYSPV